MMPCRAGDLSDEDPVRVRPHAILIHLDRIEHGCGKSKLAVGAEARLVVAMASALTSGFIVRSALSSMAITELKGRPVLLTPSFRRASSCPKGVTDQGEDKQLGDALDGKLLVSVAH